MNFKEGVIIPIDKPYGITSFKALAHIRYLCTQANDRESENRPCRYIGSSGDRRTHPCNRQDDQADRDLAGAHEGIYGDIPARCDHTQL